MDGTQKLKYYEGDYVKLKGDDTIYEFVRIDGPLLHVKYLNNDTIVNTSIQSICPIPLTQEFLYKNSYSVYNNPYFTQYALNEKYVIKEIDSKFYFEGIELLYIHELQHLIDLLKINKPLEI